MYGVAVSNRTIQANFFTPSYRIVGKIDVGNSGLIGLLNNPHTSFLELKDVSMARLIEPKKLADRLDEVRLIKRGLIAVGLARREDVGPQAIARGGYVRVNKYALRAISAIYELIGTLEWIGRFEWAVMLVEGVGDFVPLYDITLKAIQFPDLTMQSPALLFNRRKVDLINFIPRKKEG